MWTGDPVLCHHEVELETNFRKDELQSRRMPLPGPLFVSNVLNVKELVGAFNQEKALVGEFL